MRKFILDTDWWTDCDDAVAVRLLCNAHRKQQIEIVGINVSVCTPYSIPALDIFTRDAGVNVPLGLDFSAVNFSGKALYQEHLAASGDVLRQNSDAVNGIDFYWQLLTEAAAKELENISIGFPQVLSGILNRSGGMKLVAEKVRHLWIVGGKWDEDGGLEYNFSNHPICCHGASILCRLWPTPITFLGWEVGTTVISGGKLPEGDLLRQVMIDHGSENGRSSWDPMLILLAIADSPEKAGYHCVYGYATVDATSGANHFKTAANGPHRYVIKNHSDDFYVRQIDEQLSIIT